MTAAFVVLGGYLLGSMPFGYWVVRLFKGEDIRTVGSGNIGATNVWRTYGRTYGIPIVVLDVAKGFVPAVVGALLVGELVGALAGGAAMLGHWRPLFLRFQKGGLRPSWGWSGSRSGSSSSSSPGTRRSRRWRPRSRCPSPGSRSGSRGP